MTMDTIGSGAAPSILLVDDDDVARELVLRYLRKLHLRNPVVEAADGERALEILEGGEVPALVLLDLELPGQSGLDVLRWARARPSLAGLPVVMLTGSAEITQVDAAYALGISSYLVKPVGFAGLQDVIHQLDLPWQLLRD